MRLSQRSQVGIGQVSQPFQAVQHEPATSGTGWKACATHLKNFSTGRKFAASFQEILCSNHQATQVKLISAGNVGCQKYLIMCWFRDHPRLW